MIKVACWDPNGKYKPGELIEGANTISLATRQGVALLPYDPPNEKEVHRSAISPFSIAYWGQGWVFNRNSGEKGCPMVIEVQPEKPNFSWVVRVKIDDEKQVGCSAQIRFIVNPHPRGMQGGLRQDEFCSVLPEMDEHGGATVYGRSVMNSNVGGLLFTDFYCVARNIKIEWSAICQHRSK